MAPEGEQARVRGAGLMSTNKWLRETYGPETLKEILKELSPAAAESLASPLATEWYPAGFVSEIYTTIQRVAHSDGKEDFGRVLRELGRFLASDNLSTVFRVLLAFVSSPQQMFQNIDRFWGQYFQGVRVENDVSEIDRGRGTTYVYGLGEIEYLAPVSCGWTELGFTKVGARDVRCEEDAFAAGKTAADPLIFRVSWR